MKKEVGKVRKKIVDWLNKLKQKGELKNNIQKVLNTVAIDYYMYYFGAVDIEPQSIEEIKQLGKEYPEWNNLLEIFYKTLETNDFSKIKSMFEDFENMIAHRSEKEIAPKEIVYALNLGDYELLTKIRERLIKVLKVSKEEFSEMLISGIKQCGEDCVFVLGELLKNDNQLLSNSAIAKTLVASGAKGTKLATDMCLKSTKIATDKNLLDTINSLLQQNIVKIQNNNLAIKKGCRCYINATTKNKEHYATKVREMVKLNEYLIKHTDALFYYLKTAINVNISTGKYIKIGKIDAKEKYDELELLYHEAQNSGVKVKHKDSELVAEMS